MKQNDYIIPEKLNGFLKWFQIVLFRWPSALAMYLRTSFLRLRRPISRIFLTLCTMYHMFMDAT